MDAALADGEVGLVASYVLAGGTLTGKYLRGEQGRAAFHKPNPVVDAGMQAAADLDALAADWDVPAANLAFAFALDHPRLASILFGATNPAQLTTNLVALDVHRQLDANQRARLRAVGAPAPGAQT